MTTMWRHWDKPACWKGEVPPGKSEECGNFTNPQLAESSLLLTPGCEGCARTERSKEFWA